MPMALHIANGMYGAVIIDPPDLPAVAHEFVVVQSELYLGPQNGTADDAKIAAEKPDAILFNGYVNQYDHAPIASGSGNGSGCGWWTRGRSARRPSTSSEPSSTRYSRRAHTCSKPATQSTARHRC